MALNELKEVRAAAAVTNSYVASDYAQTGNSSRADIVLDFTLASLTSLEVQVLFSYDAATWRILGVESASGATITEKAAVYQFLPADWGTTATGTVIRIDCGAPLLKVQVKGTGTVTSSSVKALIQESSED
jgi:hypothetical protein